MSGRKLRIICPRKQGVGDPGARGTLDAWFPDPPLRAAPSLPKPVRRLPWAHPTRSRSRSARRDGEKRYSGKEEVKWGRGVVTGYRRLCFMVLAPYLSPELCCLYIREYSISGLQGLAPQTSRYEGDFRGSLLGRSGEGRRSVRDGDSRAPTEGTHTDSGKRRRRSLRSEP